MLRENDLAYVGIDPIRVKTAPLLDIVKVTDFGDWIMVKAGNMKITYEKASGVIVNVSGGGCPDIPYLHAELIDKRLDEAPRPKDVSLDTSRQTSGSVIGSPGEKSRPLQTEFRATLLSKTRKSTWENDKSKANTLF